MKEKRFRLECYTLSIFLLMLLVLFSCKQATKQAVKYVGLSILDAVVQYETNNALDQLQKNNENSIYKQLIGRTAYVKTINDGFLSLKAEPNIKSITITKMLDYETVKILDIQEIPMTIEGRRGVWCKVEYGELIGWTWGGWLILE